MRIIGLFSLCFIALVAYTSAQICVAPRIRDCVGGSNVGRGGFGCVQRTMWYWNGRACESFSYLGCQGNNNRWCTKAECDQGCGRRT